MKHFSSSATGRLLVAIAVLTLVRVPANGAGAVSPLQKKAGGIRNSNAAVMPVKSRPYGLTYGQWSGKFWQWLFSIPVDNHPLFGDTNDCSTGQSGPVFFLGGTFAVIETSPGVILGQANRTCTVPVGKSIFFPIVNSECSTLEGNGEDEAELRACADFFGNLIIPGSLRAAVDGVEITGLNQYRVQSPLFTFGPLPDNNVLQFFGVDAPQGATTVAVSDGVHLMLHPLSVGRHVIEYYGELDLSIFGNPGDKFIQDIRYEVIVKP